MKKAITILLPNDIPLELILEEPGYFIMGSEREDAPYDERPEHLVYITKPFYIGRYPVTKVQWQAVMGNNPSRFSGEQRPVKQVRWIDIVDSDHGSTSKPAFLTQLNNYLSVRRPDLATTHKFKLPTEAEWEYAAKGGPRYSWKELEDEKRTEYYSAYAGSDRLKTCGWFGENKDDETRPVGLKAANEFGLYDMSGNFWEWCNDWYVKDTYKNREEPVSKNPVEPENRGDLVMRGGSYWGNS